MKNIFIAACILFMGTGLFAQDAEDAPVIGFVQIGGDTMWRLAETISIKEEAGKRGMRLLFCDAQYKRENQIKAMRSFIAQKVDVILLAPVVTSGWDVVLQEAQDAGIPVFILELNIEVSDPTLYTTVFLMDLYGEGRKAGLWLAEKLNGEGTIAELYGTPGADAAVLRNNGFMDVIAEHPGMWVIRSERADFTRSKAKEVVESWLNLKLEIDVIFAHCDDMALGAIDAVKAAGLVPGEDILIVSIDGVRPAMEAIIAGELNCSVECSPRFGPLVCDAVEKYLSGQELPKTIMQTDQVFTIENAARELPHRLY
jgi:ABC-type sugar transport system substrate-binding protein